MEGSLLIVGKRDPQIGGQYLNNGILRAEWEERPYCRGQPC